MAVPPLQVSAAQALASLTASPRSARSPRDAPANPLLRAPGKDYARLRGGRDDAKEEAEKVAAAFKKYDRDGSGWMANDEVPSLMSDLSLPISAETFKQYVDLYFADIETFIVMPREGLKSMPYCKSMKVDNRHPTDGVARGQPVHGTMDKKRKWLSVRDTEPQMYLPMELDKEKVLNDRDVSQGIALSEFQDLYVTILAQQPPAVRKLATVLRVTAHDAQDQELLLRRVFEAHDVDGSGILSRPEIPTVLEELGFPDVDGDGHEKFAAEHVRADKVDFPQFAAACNELVEYVAGAAQTLVTPRLHGPHGFMTPRTRRTPR